MLIFLLVLLGFLSALSPSVGKLAYNRYESINIDLLRVPKTASTTAASVIRRIGYRYGLAGATAGNIYDTVAFENRNSGVMEQYKSSEEFDPYDVDKEEEGDGAEEGDGEIKGGGDDRVEISNKQRLQDAEKNVKKENDANSRRLEAIAPPKKAGAIKLPRKKIQLGERIGRGFKASKSGQTRIVKLSSKPLALPEPVVIAAHRTQTQMVQELTHFQPFNLFTFRIAFVRDPIERCFSHYYHLVLSRNNKKEYPGGKL